MDEDVSDWNVRSGLTILNAGLVMLFYPPLVERAVLDPGSSRNRVIYLTCAVFLSLVFDWFLDYKDYFGEMQCSLYLSVVMISPCLIVAPYFSMAMEQWGQEKKKKRRWYPMRMFGAIVGNTPQRWRAYLNMLTAIIFYAGFSVLVITYRYKVIGEDVEHSDCSLGDQLWALIILFVLNILIGLFCLYLSYDCARSKSRCGRFLLWEQNLVFLWSLVHVSVFFAFYLNLEVQEWAEQRGFVNYELLIYLNNMGPILISGVLSFVLSFCNAHLVMRGSISIANLKRNLQSLRKTADEEYQTVELYNLDGSDEEEEGTVPSLNAYEALGPKEKGRFVRRKFEVKEGEIKELSNNKAFNRLLWFFIHKESMEDLDTMNLDLGRGTSEGRSDLSLILHIRKKLVPISNSTKSLKDVERHFGVGFINEEFPDFAEKNKDVESHTEKFNLFYFHVCSICAREMIEYLSVKEIQNADDLFDDNYED